MSTLCAQEHAGTLLVLCNCGLVPASALIAFQHKALLTCAFKQTLQMMVAIAVHQQTLAHKHAEITSYVCKALARHVTFAGQLCQVLVALYSHRHSSHRPHVAGVFFVHGFATVGSLANESTAVTENMYGLTIKHDRSARQNSAKRRHKGVTCTGQATSAWGPSSHWGWAASWDLAWLNARHEL